MTRTLPALAFLAFLAACGDGQPFFDEDGNLVVDPDTAGEEEDPGTTDEDGAELDPGDAIPPGTDEPSANDDIVRFEAENGDGGGLVTDVSYNSTNDTFRVDNLGFDGANVYRRNGSVQQMNGYAVYSAADSTPDFLTDEPISQIVPYRAIFSRSAVTVNGEPRTSFAIVRTGGYVGYGFGGFIFNRSGSVVLPTSGQAEWSGPYAGIRVFDGIGGLEYTRGDIEIAVDFEDFNANDAVKGRLFNREVFDSDGNPITLAPAGTDGQLYAPNVQFVIQEGSPSLTDDGELQGELNNTVIVDGAPQLYEEGFYYGIVAGDTTTGDGGEIVGIIVLESEDPRFEGVRAQETGGFIATR